MREQESKRKKRREEEVVGVEEDSRRRRSSACEDVLGFNGKIGLRCNGNNDVPIISE